jgi:lipopolysaccharide export system protein LptC
MSVQAAELRRSRRAWAMAGSSHDRLIALLRIALPAAIGVLFAFMALAPLSSRDISFVLSKDRVAVAGERMRVTAAQYRGRDQKGEAFELTAASAVQATSRDPIVRLQTLDAKLDSPEGQASLVAGRGRYDMNSQKLALDGPVTFRRPDDLRAETSNVLVNLDDRTAFSRNPVEGSGRLGRFSADRFQADLRARTVALEGRARLHIVQSRARRRS